MTWQPFYEWWDEQMAEVRQAKIDALTQRAETTEAENERLRWQKMKLENRLQKHVHRLIKRGWANV